MICRSEFLVALFLSAGEAAHADLVAAALAFDAGRYEQAVTEAAAERTADAEAFCARALLARAMSGPSEPSDAMLKGALEAAERALKIDPRHAEGRLQKAISLSLLTRPMSLNAARKSGFGEEAKALAEAVIADDAANHYALGFLAVWHVEVHRRGGRLGALMMGASLDEAAIHYAEAVRLAPQDVGLRWQYARALAAYDAKTYRGEIGAELQAALAIDPATELDRVMQERAAMLLEAVRSEKASDAEKMAQGML